MNAAEERRCQAGIVPAFTGLMGTDRDKGSGPALRLGRPVLSLGKGLPAMLAAGDLAGDMEELAVTVPEEAEKDVTVSQTKVEGVEKAAARGQMESPEGAGPDGKMAAAVAMEPSENPEAERAAEAFARAAERIAVSEVAKVFQSAIAELKEKRRST
ncbi:uncharacterized protein LJ264_008195 isoform 1-T1 [Porphyrio hochstetteri]